MGPLGGCHLRRGRVSLGAHLETLRAEILGHRAHILVVGARRASLARDVGDEHHLALELGEGDVVAVDVLRGQIVEARHGAGGDGAGATGRAGGDAGGSGRLRECRAGGEKARVHRDARGEVRRENASQLFIRETRS